MKDRRVEKWQTEKNVKEIVFRVRITRKGQSMSKRQINSIIPVTIYITYRHSCVVGLPFLLLLPHVEPGFRIGCLAGGGFSLSSSDSDFCSSFSDAIGVVGFGVTKFCRSGLTKVRISLNRYHYHWFDKPCGLITCGNQLRAGWRMIILWVSGSAPEFSFTRGSTETSITHWWKICSALLY